MSGARGRSKGPGLFGSFFLLWRQIRVFYHFGILGRRRGYIFKWHEGHEFFRTSNFSPRSFPTVIARSHIIHEPRLDIIASHCTPFPSHPSFTNSLCSTSHLPCHCHSSPVSRLLMSSKSRFHGLLLEFRRPYAIRSLVISWRPPSAVRHINP